PRHRRGDRPLRPRDRDVRPTRHPPRGHHRPLRPSALLRDRARPRVRGAALAHLEPAARGRAHRRGDRMSTAPAARTTTTADDREHRTLVAARAQRARDRRLATRDLVLSIATPILLLVLWELCARVEVIDPRFFPPPT